MKLKVHPTTKKLVTCLLAVLLALGVPANYVVKSQSLLGGTELTQNLLQNVKVSSDLVEKTLVPIAFPI
jgi:uncharacterized protein HemX